MLTKTILIALCPAGQLLAQLALGVQLHVQSDAAPSAEIEEAPNSTPEPNRSDRISGGYTAPVAIPSYKAEGKVHFYRIMNESVQNQILTIMGLNPKYPDYLPTLKYTQDKKDLIMGSPIEKGKEVVVNVTWPGPSMREEIQGRNRGDSGKKLRRFRE